MVDRESCWRLHEDSEQIRRCIGSKGFLSTAGFQGVMVPPCYPDDIGAEVELANFAGRFGFTIVKNFIKRMIYLDGWPYKWFKYLRGAGAAVECITSFKDDLALHKDD